MVRTLMLIAAAGFVLSVASLSAAVAIGGPDAIAGVGWRLIRDDEGDFGENHGDAGPEVTRTVPWTGGDTLDLRLRAAVRYIQADGPGSITLTGPARALDRVVVDGGDIGRTGRGWSASKVRIVIRAPAVTRFHLSGASDLTIEDYRQDRLSVRLLGSSELTARGETRRVDLEISGSGEADLGDLRTRAANVEISGSGEAVVAPTERASLEISGTGDVTLLTRPAQLTTDISGSGTVHQPDPADAPSNAPAPGGA